LTLGDLLIDKAARHGGSVFAEIAGTPVSYVELEQRSRAVAANLLARGLRGGDRVASFMANAPEQLYCFFGCARAGLVWVPINAGLSGDDLAYTLRDSGARMIVADADGASEFERIRRPSVSALELFTTSPVDGVSSTSFSELLAGERLSHALPETTPTDPGAILYTGGTTGLPKGVVLPQLSFILAGVRYGESFSVRQGERHYSTMPLFHAGCLQWGLMGPLVNDMSTVIDRRFSASGYLARLRDTRADVIDAFGVMITMLCAQPVSPDDRNHSVRLSVGAVHGLPPEIPREFTRRFGIPLLMLYGLTEGGGAMLTTNRDFDGESNGRPHGWVEIRIADSLGFPLPAGEVGDVLLRATWPHMFMTGYFNDSAKTLATYRDCWLHTGDLGKVDSEGNFWFVGRGSHRLRRRGENISALEVEMILAKCPGVREAAVIGVPSELGEDEVKAFIVPAPGHLLDPAAIVAWSAGRMASFKIPRFVEFLEDLPRSTAKMEIDRGALRKRPNDAAWDSRKDRR
jgi:crotonobetaine/carnitine-CoA ligase